MAVVVGIVYGLPIEPRFFAQSIQCLSSTVMVMMSSMLFYIVNKIYEYYEARSAISLFQINEFFSHHFRGFKIEIFDPHNVRNPIRSPDLSNEY